MKTLSHDHITDLRCVASAEAQAGRAAYALSLTEIADMLDAIGLDFGLDHKRLEGVLYILRLGRRRGLYKAAVQLALEALEGR